MIGGYLFRSVDERVRAQLLNKLDAVPRFNVDDHGFMFCSNPFREKSKTNASGPDGVAVCEDLIIGDDGSGNYRRWDLQRDFLDSFRGDGFHALDRIQSDARIAVAWKEDNRWSLFLASHRAGSGRIYYHKLVGGILFCSDLRFLCGVIPFDVNPIGIYSILKYGSIPEPLTIARDISAVPVAHFVKYDVMQGEERVQPYFSYRFSGETSDASVPLNETREVLMRSARIVGDFPSAMLLSGGIDSSLYACYLAKAGREPLQAFYCAFGTNDPEYPYAEAIARRIGVHLNVASMDKEAALPALDEAVRLSDHPFADFSSLPIVFLLQHIREHTEGRFQVVECNGGDDCFGFPALQDEKKYRLKHLAPRILKRGISGAFRNSTYWKWESSEGTAARLSALADAHESTFLNYFLILAPVHYVAPDVPRAWDEILEGLIEQTSSRVGEDYDHLGYEAKTTIRQLLYVNSARWAAKALSVGESLGIRVVYPYIWRDILRVQGRLPWKLKVRDGIVKWPLKNLLEEFMPADFIYRKKSGFVPPFVRWLTDPECNHRVRDILTARDAHVSQIIPKRTFDDLLADALRGKRLRFPVLNMLWGAFFTESWMRNIH